MTTREIANRLYELCSQGQFETAQHEICAYEVKDGKIVSERFFY